MSVFERNEPKTTGQPGFTSWVSAIPDSASAICWTSVAGIETGDIAPMSRNGVVITACSRRLYSSIALSIRSSQRSGELQLISEMLTGASGSVAAERDLAHGDRVARVLGRDHRAHVRLVGQRLERVDHVEVARVQRAVLGLDDRPAGGVELGERLRQLHEVLEVGHLARRGACRPRARTAARRRRRRPCGRRRCGRLAPGCAPDEVELARRLGDLLEDELGVEEHLVAVDLLTRRAEVLDGLGQHELDAELGDDPAPAAVEDRHRVLAQDLVAGHLVDVHAAPVLDVALGDRNISSVEQEFQPTHGTQVHRSRGAAPGARARSRDPAPLGELAADAGLPKSTASRLLGALERNGLVEQEGLRGAFRAGPCRPLRRPRALRAAARRGVRAPDGRARRGDGGDDQRRRRRARRRRAPRAGREPPLPRHEPLGRPPRAVPLHRERQGAARVRRRRRRRGPARAAHLAHDHRAGARSPPSSATVRRETFATAVDELELGLSAVAAPVLDESGRADRGAQRVRPDAAALAAPRRRAATDRDQAGAGARGSARPSSRGSHAT